MTRAATFLFPSYRPRHRPLRYGGRDFSAPKLMTEALLPPQPGIYAIQVRSWWMGMEPIDFGASHNLREDVMGESHVSFVHWLMHPRSKHGLYVSFNVVPDLDHESRHRERDRLNRHYFPRRTHSVDEHLANHRIHRMPRSVQAGVPLE